MDKAEDAQPDLTQENIAKIARAVSRLRDRGHGRETGSLKLAVDFDQLRQELSDHVVEGPQERYQLDWPGSGKRCSLPTPRSRRRYGLP